MNESRTRNLLIGTNNSGKVTEITELLSGLPVEILTPIAVGITSTPPEETGSTFHENAVIKAQYYYRESGVPTIADDSGIVVDALQNELGVHTRRWGAGADASDDEWITYFLQRMRVEENRNARFLCTIAYIDENSALHMFEGACEGEITEELEADYLPGLPISACFRPKGFDRVYSAMTVDQKNAMSHRGKAVQQLHSHLALTTVDSGK